MLALARYTSKMDTPASKTGVLLLPSGRQVEVLDAPEGIAIRGADGLVEISIELGINGPKVRVRAASLVLEGTEAIELNAPHIALHATENMSLTSTQGINVQTQGDISMISQAEIKMEGTMIHLN
jgi:hypothetical protein